MLWSLSSFMATWEYKSIQSGVLMPWKWSLSVPKVLGDSGTFVSLEEFNQQGSSQALLLLSFHCWFKPLDGIMQHVIWLPAFISHKLKRTASLSSLGNDSPSKFPDESLLLLLIVESDSLGRPRKLPGSSAVGEASSYGSGSWWDQQQGDEGRQGADWQAWLLK